jgi:hypothetical protein
MSGDEECWMGTLDTLHVQNLGPTKLHSDTHQENCAAQYTLGWPLSRGKSCSVVST